MSQEGNNNKSKFFGKGSSHFDQADHVYLSPVQCFYSGG